jgi:hypothetical protein
MASTGTTPSPTRGCNPAHGLPTRSQPNGACRTSRSRTAPFGQRRGSTSCGIGTLTGRTRLSVSQVAQHRVHERGAPGKPTSHGSSVGAFRAKALCPPVTSAWLWNGSASLGQRSRRKAAAGHLWSRPLRSRRHPGGASADTRLTPSAASGLRDQHAPRPEVPLAAYPFVQFLTPSLDDVTHHAEVLGAQLMRFIAPMLEHMARRCEGHLTNLPTAAKPGAANLRSLSPVRHRRTTTSLGPAARSPTRKLKTADVPALTWLTAALTTRT